MKIKYITSALVVLFLTASTYTFAQNNTIVISPGSSTTSKVVYDTVTKIHTAYPVQKRSSVKPTPKLQKFFDNGLTGINDAIWRFEDHHDLVGDYNSGKNSWDEFDELVTRQLSQLNQRYGWGFKSVDKDTALWILRNSDEVYRSFGPNQHTIFYFDKNGWVVPQTRASVGAEKIIVFNGIPYINCASGGLMMPAEPTGSYPVRLASNPLSHPIPVVSEAHQEPSVYITREDYNDRMIMFFIFMVMFAVIMILIAWPRINPVSSVSVTIIFTNGVEIIDPSLHKMD